MTGTERYRVLTRLAEELSEEIKFHELKSDKPFSSDVKRPTLATKVKALTILEEKRVFIPLGTCVILSETSQK